MTIPNVSLNDPATSTWANAVADTINGLVETHTYTPSLTNVAIGTGGSAENSAQYTFIGDPTPGAVGQMLARGTVVLGSSGQSVTGQPTIGLPSGFEFQAVDTEHHLPSSFRLDPDGGGGSKYIGVARIASATTFIVNYLTTTSGIVIAGAISASDPATWSAGGWIRWSFTAVVVRT